MKGFLLTVYVNSYHGEFVPPFTKAYPRILSKIKKIIFEDKVSCHTYFFILENDQYFIKYSGNEKERNKLIKIGPYMTSQ